MGFFLIKKNDMRGEVTYLLLLLCSSFSPFHCCLSVVLWPEEGDFPENLHRVVYVIIDKRSFESFMCLDPILER